MSVTLLYVEHCTCTWPPDITREKVLAVLSHTVPVDIQC